MKTFAEIKAEIRDDSSIKHHKYGRFLDRLIDYDQRGKQAAWDLWYFSHNTDWCIAASNQFLQEITQQGREYHAIQQNLSAKTALSFDKLRVSFGSFCVYLHAALESFAHETNLFYEIDMSRKDVGIKQLAKKLAGRTEFSLSPHLQLVNPDSPHADSDLKMLIAYRNRIAHGYVYPISGMLLKEDPPQNQIIDFEDLDVNLVDFAKNVHDRVVEFIAQGWLCFTEDKLTPKP